MKRRVTIGFILVTIVLAVFLLPLAIGVWVPDIFYAKRHVIAHAETPGGHKFDVVQYWNRCDFYNTEVLHTGPSGRILIHVLDGDDAKVWQVPISVDEKTERVSVGGYATLYYGRKSIEWMEVMQNE